MTQWQHQFIQSLIDRIERLENKVIQHCAEITRLKEHSIGSKKKDPAEKLYYIGSAVLALYVLHSINPDFLKAIMPILGVMV